MSLSAAKNPHFNWENEATRVLFHAIALTLYPNPHPSTTIPHIAQGPELTLSSQKGAMHPIRHNPIAILLATLLYFVLGAFWFTAFQQAWLVGIGRTMHEIMATNHNPFFAYAIALVGTFILALFLSWLIQTTGNQTTIRGIFIAVFTWVGVVLPTWSTEYAFEARGLRILVINTGYILTGMIIMGAILGGWKKKKSA
ncbi:MAG TPA: DUF1761 domain-containing protein [Edaphobacter sp.]|nr:DUF1761 domain-containing protein [Edaphobacter sp.]